MIKIGIIGAGAISLSHLDAYKANPDCQVIAIADLNTALAQQRADAYNIEKVFSDYKELLADPEIDAVSVVTPTFTHTSIVIDALNSGKNVLCEKPPALTTEDAKKCEEVAKKSGKLLMYALVCRFHKHAQYLKHYIDSGKMGEIAYAEAARICNYSALNGWFCDKTKSGGYLFDSAIHELDLALYFMGYPKPKTVLGFSSNINNDLPNKIKNADFTYTSADPTHYERTIESFCTGMVLLDNGACLNVQGGAILNHTEPRVCVDLCGKSAGAKFKVVDGERKLRLLELSDDGYFSAAEPLLGTNEMFTAQINHFVDCCLGKTECIVKPSEAVTLVEIINAIYKSAETGKAVEF